MCFPTVLPAHATDIDARTDVRPRTVLGEERVCYLNVRSWVKVGSASSHVDDVVGPIVVCSLPASTCSPSRGRASMNLCDPDVGLGLRGICGARSLHGDLYAVAAVITAGVFTVHSVTLPRGLFQRKCAGTLASRSCRQVLTCHVHVDKSQGASKWPP